MTKSKITTTWTELEPQWWRDDRGNVVRGPRSGYRNGWWLLPGDKPDLREFDVGPFRSMKRAMEAVGG